ncbi:MAG TPA: metallophosphoesterase [Candidatus Angelobacter sp.]|nr:metallophosphoesterase [Candidatus Angelobacter sp.]
MAKQKSGSCISRIRQFLAGAAVLTAMITHPSLSPNAYAGEQSPASKAAPLEEGVWRFIVSGDSRNCGDVVMPAIAAHSAERFAPAFYWHLGDLRAIYKVDEDMAGAAQLAGQYLSCQNYIRIAWDDFIDHQIVPFGTTRFYLGIGNHETIPIEKGTLFRPKEEFLTQFEDWLMTPRRQMWAADKDEIAAATTGPCGRVAAARPYISPTAYYHWIRGSVDFLYLDNSTGAFDKDQLDWFDCTLERARRKEKVRTVIVGMHEALPDSRAAGHAMCDQAIRDPKEKQASCDSGKHVYDALVELQKIKNVYVLASHSHFYMRGIFDNRKPSDRLEGWIVGTAGAVRYPLPDGVDPGPDAIKDTYGYLVGTVHPEGTVAFAFEEVKETDVPAEVRKQYPSSLISWCYAKNSHAQTPDWEETTNRCVPTAELPAAQPVRRKSAAPRK